MNTYVKTLHAQIHSTNKKSNLITSKIMKTKISNAIRCKFLNESLPKITADKITATK